MEDPIASAATPAALPDLLPPQHHVHEQHIDETIGLDTPEQLLTPENSRSETSSNNENASNEDNPNPTLRRKSTRVTRASLRVAELNTPESENSDNSSSVTKGVGLLNGVARGKKSQSSHLRHSIAVMESSLWSETSDPQSNTESDKRQFAPDTPISETSQEPSSGEVDTSPQRRSLRKRAGRVSTKEETPDEEKATAESKDDDEQPVRRRSGRLSILEKATGLVDRASTVLGKRTRNATKKEKEPSRRASLRPRNVAPPKEEPAHERPAAKKRRVSDSDIPAKKSEEESEEEDDDEETEESAPAKYTPKRWLAHGLYSGQEPTDGRPLQNKNNKTTKRRSQRKLLPMPLFAGDRLLKHGRDFVLPFDIFSPLPPGQPKPNEWRKTNKNVFVGEAGSIWRANKDPELSKCMCIPETGCDENCQNRYMFYECDNGNCSLGPNCGNRSFNEIKQRTKAGGKYNIGVEVIKTLDRGYGVRSNRTFEPNQIIVEYTGEIITQSECEKRMRTIYKKNECYYLMYFDQNMIIDATRGSIARFVNHSCEPNCRMEKWTVSGKPRMALFAGDRGIMTGEELTYDYNFDPYSQRNVQQCRCGSSVCRGVLGPRPREKEQRSKERESRADNQKKSTSNTKTDKKTTASKRKIGSVIEESASRLNKKRKVVKPRSVRSGVGKVVSKARTTVSRKPATRKEPVTKRKTKETTRKTTKATKAKATAKTTAKSTANASAKAAAKTPAKTTAKTTAKASTKATTKATAKTPAKTAAKADAKPKRQVKLPKVNSKTKVKTTVRTTTKRASGPAKAQEPKTKAPSKLNRPSAATKAKILATAQGTGSRRRVTKKTDAKEEVKVPKKRGRKPKNPDAAKDAKASPKKAARSVKANKK